MSKYSIAMQTKQAQARAVVATWLVPQPSRAARFYCQNTGRWYTADVQGISALCRYCDAYNRSSDEPGYDPDHPGVHGVWSER